MVVLLLAYAAFAHLYAGSVASTEHDVKAAYLLNILKLVQRKDAPPERKNVVLCLVNSGAVSASLHALDGSLVAGRRLAILTISKGDDVLSCDVVFLGRTSGHLETLARAKSLGLLTIGNDSDFIAKSGMVALLVEGRKIVIEVSAEAIRSSNWTFSSHLLEIARVTHLGGIR